MTYFRFLLLMGLGIFGLSLALKTLLDRVFLDWDLIGEIRRYLSQPRKSRYMQIYDYDPDLVDVRPRLAPRIEMEDLALPEIPALPTPPPPPPVKQPQTAFLAPITPVPHRS